MTNIFEDYEALIHTNGKWEKLNTNNIITNTIDFSDYVTQETLNNKLDDKADKNTVKTLEETLEELTEISLKKIFLTSKNDLPNKGDNTTLYFVFTDTEEENRYDEYVWVEDDEKYEQIGTGTTQVDYTEFLKLTTLNDLARKGVNLSKFTSLVNDVLGSDMDTEDLACIRASDEFHWLLLDAIVEALLTDREYYTKTETDNLISSSSYTKSQVNSLLNTKANTSDVYNKTNINTLLENYCNYDDIIDGLWDTIENINNLKQISGYTFTDEYTILYEVLDAIVKLVLNSSEDVDLSNYYTKTEVDNLIGDIDTYLGT